MNNYPQLLERISSASKLTKEDIERKIEAKRAKLSGLVSKEGAAQIVAAELGINLDQEKLKISELFDGMRKANIHGKILQISPIREFQKNKRQGKVCNLLIADDTSNVKVVLWDTTHITLIENNSLQIGDFIEISNGSVRNSEIHLSSFSDFKKSKEKIEKIIEERTFQEKKLVEIKSPGTIKTRGIIVQSFEPRYFEINPETGRKLTDEEKSQGIKSEKRALLNFVIDDGTETIRSVAFGNEIETLGLKKDEIFSLEKFEKAKDKILGEEFVFEGNIRKNNLYNITELVIEKISRNNVDEIINKLEK